MRSATVQRYRTVTFVIRSLSAQIVGGWGFDPDPTGELAALPQTPSLGLRCLLLKLLFLRRGEEKGWEKKRGEEAKMIYAPGRQKPSLPTGPDQGRPQGLKMWTQQPVVSGASLREMIRNIDNYFAIG